MSLPRIVDLAGVLAVVRNRDSASRHWASRHWASRHRVDRHPAQLARMLAVGQCAGATAGGSQRRVTGGRGLSKPDRFGDGRFEHRHPVAAGDVGEHLAGMVGAPVVQRRQHAQDTQPPVRQTLHVMHGVEQLTHAAVGERLALQRHENAVSRR